MLKPQISVLNLGTYLYCVRRQCIRARGLFVLFLIKLVLNEKCLYYFASL